MAKKETKVQEEVKEVKAPKAVKSAKKAKKEALTKEALTKEALTKEEPKEECGTACECENKCIELTKEEVLEMAKLHNLIAEVERFIALMNHNIKFICVRLADCKVESLKTLNKYSETDRQKEIFGDSIQTLADRLSEMSLMAAILDSATSPISRAFGLASLGHIEVKD